MTRKMLVNATHSEENRVAIVEDGILSELDIEIAGQEQTKGNIYKATVVRVESGLQAAFVDYGAERLGFLQLGEIHPSLYPERDSDDRNRPRINEILRRGQELLVQIVKEERGTKGAALTTFLSLAGRYMVLMPGDKARGISRKIPDGDERKALRKAIDQLELPEDMGIIVRTAALGHSSEELQRDLDYLLKLYRSILELADRSQAPSLIYQESNLVIRSIRDYFTPDMDEVLVDDPQVHRQAKDFFAQVMPEHQHLVKLHQEQRPIFARYQIEEQIETITQNQVSLPSGGSIVIDQTEALVAIDVNSGRMSSEQGIEATAYKTNIEAAREVARQLRLRDLGGLIVIDFIDMRDRGHTRDVERTLKDALAGDKARVTVGRISQFGLLEMSRQRIKAALAAGAWNTCPHCNGRGRVRSTETQAVATMRKIHASIAKKQIARIELTVPAEVATYLLNNRREELLDMERRYRTTIAIYGDSDLTPDEIEIELEKREKQDQQSREETGPVTAEAALAGATEERDAESAPETAEPEVEKEASESGRKRRRRRRRRKAASGSSQPEQAHAEQEQATKEEKGEQPASAAAETAPVTGVSEASPVEPGEQQAEEKPKRRTRRKKTAEIETPTEPAASQSAETEDKTAEEKPKRRTRRKKTTEAETSEEPVTTQPTETED
ncbi:MAG: Rne/Rng family ribonuclease, partial [Deltaproteobacteria bacterium]